MAEKKKKSKFFGWFTWVIAIFFVLVALVFTYAYFYHVAYAQKFYPGFKLGSVDLAGKNYLEVLDMFSNFANKIREDGFIYKYQDNEIFILPVVSSEQGSDIVYELYKFDEKATVEEAYDYGRTGNIFKDAVSHISSLVVGTKVNLKYTFDEAAVKKILEDSFSEYETPAENAHLVVNDDGSLAKSAEKEGLAFDFDAIIRTTKEHIDNLSPETIDLALAKDLPEITAGNTDQAIILAKEVLALPSVKLTYKDKSWEIKNADLKKFLDFKFLDHSVTVGFNSEFEKYLTDTVAKDIDVEVKEGKFEIQGDKVLEFQASQNGQALAIDDSIMEIDKEVVNKKNTIIELVVEEVRPAVTTDSINEMGIKELVGRGTSNFKGSPRNRIHNIEVGAKTLHGLLIKPGEEFSLVKALGEIDAKAGYLPELVIKGNKTVPEYGGGLCQIGTTAFRVALYSGLPIIERKPHSYRVSYYEPAGMDATIYDPKPDLRFINDTGHYLLWQTRIEGTDLIFEFYGTSDGRKVDITQPVLSNFVSPGPTKYIESDSLPAGQTKCTEKAHTGASAVFYRTVTKASGEEIKETWSSKYRPWQAVCLVGKAD